MLVNTDQIISDIENEDPTTVTMLARMIKTEVDSLRTIEVLVPASLESTPMAPSDHGGDTE